MTILFVLIPLGRALTGAAIWAFFWAVSSGQFDDLESPGWSVLAEPAPTTAADQKQP